MKKILLLFVIIIFTCCSNQKKCEITIHKYLKENLDDYKSYESISFSEIDTSWTSIFNDYNYIHNEDRIQECNDSVILLCSDNTMKFDKNKSIELLKEVIITNIINDSLYKNFKQQPEFLYMSHKYRAKNKFGIYQNYKKFFKLTLNMDTCYQIDNITPKYQ